jgi:2-aminobenzoate-CoA ligase
MTSAHVDSYVTDHLPDAADWPELIFDLPELRYPDQMNAAARLIDDTLAEGHGGRTAIYSAAGNWTYEDLNEAANRIANLLVNQTGLVPGNRVLLHCPNNPALAAQWLGVLKAGGVVVATMPLLRAGELKRIIGKARISHAIVDQRLANELRAAGEACPELVHLLTCGVEGTLEAAMGKESAEFETVATASDDPALLAFTSGTTGEPKACVHFHRDILVMADTFSRRILEPQQDEIFAGSPPFAFTYGLGGLLVFPLDARAATVLDETSGPKALLESIERFRVTTLFTAPTAYRAMLGLLEGSDVSSLRKCVSAGETLDKATSDAWFEATDVRPIDGIGATEMIHIFISASGDDIRPGATGKPVPGFEAAVLDGAGKVSHEGSGRLVVKGPTGCRYLDDRRQKDYVHDGWNVTGDTYSIDADGYFWFQARNDDMIVSGGYNIAGPEVEAALMVADQVAECAVVGAPDAARGQIVKAYVVLAKGFEASDVTARALQDFVKATIAPYKYPRAVAFIDELPKTQTGKIQRFRLRQAGEHGS